ncbi:MAG: GAF domain-containing sensor histidine kinase [Chloroflexota bacterium]
MRASATPYSADWIAISLRWVFLVVWIATQYAGDALTALTWPVAAILVWNLSMTGLAGMNARIPYHRHVNTAVDVLLTGALYWLQGGLRSPAFWAGLLPILTSAVYFEIAGALATAGLFAALVLAREWSHPSEGPWIPFAWMAVALASGGVLGGAVALLIRSLRSRRRAWIAADEALHRDENERLRAIYDLTSALTATLSYMRVLDAALDLGCSALNPDGSTEAAEPLVGAILLFRGGKLQVEASRRFTAADARVVFPAADGILKRVFDESEPVHSQDVGYDPELSRVIALRSCTSVYCCPLRTGFNVYGTLLFAHPQPDYFTPVRRDVLDIIGRQSAIAVQNARLYQDLAQEKERMVEVHEEARKKLARDLHDGPTQSVAAMAMRISMARRMLETDPAGAGDELTKISDLAQRAGKEIRHTLFTLRPLILESQGLGAAVQSIADKMRETFNQNVLVDVDEQLARELEAGKQGLLFYIIEEAMSNARKHANASNIWVRLRRYRPGVALLEVEDDGAGFDVAAVTTVYDKRSSLGLINLRERAELVNGVLDIRSTMGRGTRISVYVPLTREAADRLQQAKAGAG